VPVVGVGSRDAHRDGHALAVMKTHLRDPVQNGSPLIAIAGTVGVLLTGGRYELANPPRLRERYVGIVSGRRLAHRLASLRSRLTGRVIYSNGRWGGAHHPAPAAVERQPVPPGRPPSAGQQSRWRVVPAAARSELADRPAPLSEVGPANDVANTRERAASGEPRRRGLSHVRPLKCDVLYPRCPWGHVRLVLGHKTAKRTVRADRSSGAQVPRTAVRTALSHALGAVPRAEVLQHGKETDRRSRQEIAAR